MTRQKHAQVQYYLTLLVKRFSQDLAALSGTGVKLPGSCHIPLRIHQSEPEKDREKGYAPSGSAPQSPELLFAAEQKDLEFVLTWSKSKRKPLLILAPFGSGKSVLLARFAVMLAHRALKQIKDKQFSSLAIPWPVRLRDWLAYQQKSPNADFQEFMWSSPEMLLTRQTDASRLQRPIPFKTFEALLSADALVPLFDGFDELPDELVGRMKNSPSRQRALEEIGGCCGGYVLSSRPGALAHPADAGFSEDRQQVLGGLERAEMLVYIGKRFEKDLSLHKKALKALDKPHPHVEPLLRRPLFLAIWCESVQSDTSEPFSRLEDLMKALVVQCLNGRRKRTVLSETMVDRIMPKLASVIFLHATFGFGAVVGVTNLRERWELYPGGLKKGELSKYRKLAIVAGFLGKVGGNRTYAFKVPVNEFLAASRLVTLADGQASDDQKRLAINVFRRWVWLPELHDTLDMFFAMLGNDQGPNGGAKRKFAEACLEWLLMVSAKEPSRATSVKMPMKDDLATPFVFAALRWCGQWEVSDAMCEKIVSECFQVCREQWVHKRFNDLFPAYCDDRIIELCANKILVQHSTAKDKEDKKKWLHAIWTVTTRVRENSAPSLVEKLIDQHTAIQDREAISDWHYIIQDAAARVCEDDVAELVEKWIDRHNTTKGGKEKWAWRKAIETAAGRVCENGVGRLIEKWINPHNATQDEVKRWAWHDAIKAAAERVGGNNAGDLIEQWIDRHNAAPDPVARSMWRIVIRIAALRVREDDADNLCKKWINQHNAAQDENARNAWREVIGEAAWRVRENGADDLIKKLIDQHNTGRDEEERIAWRHAIWNAARHVQENEVADLIKKWIDRHNTAQNNEARSAWRYAIEAAAWRVQENDAADLVEKLIYQHGAAEDERTRSSWWNAIRDAAVRVHEDDAAALVEKLIDLYGTAQDEQEKNEWRYAIRDVAVRVHRDGVADYIDKLADLHHASQSEEERRAWRNGIWMAARRVREDIAADLAMKWFDRHDAAQNEEERRMWREVIGPAAERVHGKAAAALVEKCADQCNAAQDEETRNPWLFAVGNAAGRVPEEDAADCVRKWADRYDAAQDDAGRSAWSYAFWRAASCVRHSLKKQELLQLLLDRGWSASAFDLAIGDQGVTITSVIERDSVNGTYSANGQFQARLRNDPKLLLDEHLVAIPDSLANFFGNPGSKASEKVEAPAPSSFSPPRRYIFRCLSKNRWEFAFGGESIRQNCGLIGLGYIARLLASPGRWIDYREFKHPGDQSIAKASEGFTSDPIFADNSDKELNELLVKLKTDPNDDPEYKKKVVEFEGKIEAELRGRKSRFKRKRHSPKPSNSAVTAVDQALERAYQYLTSDPEFKLLGLHLLDHIDKHDYSRSYRRSEPPLDWDADWRIPGEN